MTDATAAAREVAKAKRQRVGGVLAPAGFSWALFEFARNPYYMLIITYVFPPYFAQFVIGDPVEGQATVAEATKWAGVIGALTSPVLGAMMDRGGRRKPVMAIFLCMLMISGVSLWWTMPGVIETAADGKQVFHPPTAGLGLVGTMCFLVFGYVGYSYSEMMHNAMLRSAGRSDALSRISGVGLGLGQLSSALCLSGLAVIALAMPTLGEASTGYVLQRGTGPFVAFWMLIFVIPFFFYVPDGAPEGGSWSGAARQIFSNNGKIDPVGRVAGVVSYLRGLIRTYPETMKYLAACLIYKDGLIALLGLGGVYSAGVLGWGLVESILYGIWASIFGTIGGVFLAGPMDRILGVRRAIILQLAVMCAGVVIALGVTQESIFYGLIPSAFKVHDLPVFNSLSDVFYLALIAVIAAVATANISSSRYMMIVLAPKERLSEFFGLFALSSTATVWLGPMLTEFATRTSGDQRIGFSPVLLLLGIGLALMFTLKADVAEGRTAPPPGAAH